MFSEMEFISKIFRRDEREVLKMCTLNSAQVLKEAEFIGTIEEGKKANLVVIRTDTPNMRNVRNPIKGVVRRATRNDIAAVIYEGKVVNAAGLRIQEGNRFLQPKRHKSSACCLCDGEEKDCKLYLTFPISRLI